MFLGLIKRRLSWKWEPLYIKHCSSQYIISLANGHHLVASNGNVNEARSQF